jgi:hypothetical protein
MNIYMSHTLVSGQRKWNACVVPGYASFAESQYMPEIHSDQFWDR